MVPVNVTVSVPVLPFTVSVVNPVPATKVNVSSPAPPVMLSIPAPPVILNLPFVSALPINVSTPELAAFDSVKVAPAATKVSCVVIATAVLVLATVMASILLTPLKLVAATAVLLVSATVSVPVPPFTVSALVKPVPATKVNVSSPAPVVMLLVLVPVVMLNFPVVLAIAPVNVDPVNPVTVTVSPSATPLIARLDAPAAMEIPSSTVLSATAIPIVPLVGFETVRFPVRPVIFTVPAAPPPEVMVRAVLFIRAVVSILTVSVAAPAATFTDVAAVPVVMLIPLSAALAVVIASVPVRLEATISPTKLFTTNAEALADARVSAAFCANAVAFTVTVSLALLAISIQCC